MHSTNKRSQEFFDKIKKRIPENIKIKKVTNSNKELAEKYLKSRKNLEITFNPIQLHFGENWDYEKYPLGYLMMNTKNNFIVGFLETIFSKRIINQKEVICCSLAQWYVEKEFRLYSYAFFFPLLEKRIIISATAPRKSLIGFFKKFNFDIQSLKYSAGFGINFLSFFSQNYKRFEILDKEIDILNELNKKDKKIYQDHKKFNCINFVIKDKTQKTESLYFLLKRKKRYNLNVLDILYISNINECKKYAPEICTKICLRSKNIFIGQIYSNDNDKLKYNPNFVIKTVRKLFPFKKINDESFSDYLYSEQIMFND